MKVAFPMPKASQIHAVSDHRGRGIDSRNPAHLSDKEPMSSSVMFDSRNVVRMPKASHQIAMDRSDDP